MDRYRNAVALTLVMLMCAMTYLMLAPPISPAVTLSSSDGARTGVGMTVLAAAVVSGITTRRTP